MNYQVISSKFIRYAPALLFLPNSPPGHFPYPAKSKILITLSARSKQKLLEILGG
jgi:hypothetical protein